jgi:hypothetical protein
MSMATKAELEAEIASLRKQNASPEPEAEQDPKNGSLSETSAPTQLEEGVQRALEEHGGDGADVEAVQKQLMDELTRLQKEYPLAMLLGTFALGVVVGRALK